MAILRENTIEFISNSVEQTVRLGVRLGELLQPYDYLYLSGDLGAGKTALARGIGRGWGTTHRITSPTYVIIHEYPRARDGLILYHLDCYRLASADEALNLGFDDLLASQSAMMVEWPEQIKPVLPKNGLWVNLRYISDTRRGLRFEATGTRATELLKTFRQSAFGV
ncbi:MAG TPA: tRNA (adenosine(37)-N6)-threonylcarbamoyltransferase complex ATPase subunit type 1 TsaE [Anaerolineae bacterium]|nr:tRNA (adenosine(37)-N6)-threonylcarbamoyltransferase complex ATPase subunit type 1 TsaE [Anaerolineae bacterium]